MDRLSLDAEVAQLVRPYKHRERRLTRDPQTGKERAGHHLTEWPSLLDQLRVAVAEPTGQVEAAHRVPESIPPGNFGALGALLRIEAGAAQWVSARLRAEPRPTVEGNLSYLLGSAYGQLALTSQIESAVHRWWSWARIESTWDDPPRSLGDPCPYCGSQTVRVRIVTRGTQVTDESAGWCTECAETWEGAGPCQVLGSMLSEARQERERRAEQRREQERERRLAEQEVGAHA